MIKKMLFNFVVGAPVRFIGMLIHDDVIKLPCSERSCSEVLHGSRVHGTLVLVVQ